MSTEVDNKNPAAAPAAEDKPAADAPAADAAAATAPAAEEAKDKAAAEGAGGDTKAEAAADAPAKEEDAVAADKAAPAEAAPAKPEPPVKYNVHRQNFEKDIVYLYQFSRTPVLPSLSPYCLKVETWLRLAGLKYEVSEVGKFACCGWVTGWKSDSPVGGHFILKILPAAADDYYDCGSCRRERASEIFLLPTSHTLRKSSASLHKSSRRRASEREEGNLVAYPFCVWLYGC